MDFRDRPLGVIPSPPDFRDYRLGQFTDIEIKFPDNYIVPPYKNINEIPVYDQNGYGMCVAFSLASLKEQQEYLETGKPIRMSPCWIYGNREAGMYMGEGMIPREAMAMLCRDGVSRYADLPNLGNFRTCYELVLRNRDKLKKNAEVNRVLSYVALNTKDADEIRTAIMKCGFININIAVYDDFYSVKDFLGNVKGKIHGYHAVTCAGWITHKSKLYFIILNSWGKKWGMNGFCYMPFDYKAIQEIWAVTDMKRRVIDAAVEARIVSPGHFVIPFRGLFEAENAEVINWRRNENGKIEAEAILPPAKRRRVYVLEGSKSITVEEVG
jgi:hypothetical protein